MKISTPEASGVLVLDKPAGMTSHDVVARLRGVLGIRRVGHAGTLDPMATGVLVLGFGRGTRLLPYLQATTKEYLATIRLGLATTTDDRTGEPLHDPVAVTCDEAAIDTQLGLLTGDIAQRPSAVSAVKVDGQRAYARVRRGEQVELAARPVTIQRFERLGPARRTESGGLAVDVQVISSSGTYVRALARDLGNTLGCGGHLTSLHRVAVGPFRIEAAAPVPGPTGPAPAVVSLAAAAGAVLPTVLLDDQDRQHVCCGLRIECQHDAPIGPVALLADGGELVAIAAATAGKWHYLAVFAAPLLGAASQDVARLRP